MTILASEYLHKGNDDYFVFRDLSIDLSSEDILAVIGPSGSSKTTLLKILNLIMPFRDILNQ
ncbi:hypothetical protein DRN87_04020 [Candidatus Geothermarchaeota archaeon]|nr:MAG: hypothetical protein DRN87_04020 [Candidatus Geothermarchaeota archaeon]